MKWRYILFFSIAMIGCIGFCASCDISESKSDTISVKNSISPTELEQLDIKQAPIAPLYLPSVVDNRAINPSYHKSGLTATIEADQNTIVSFEFCKLEADDASFPSSGEALVTEDDSKIVLHYRMSDSYGCIIASDSLSKQELEKIINSFTIRSVPSIMFNPSGYPNFALCLTQVAI